MILSTCIDAKIACVMVLVYSFSIQSDCTSLNLSKCSNGQCILPSLECDGYPQCSDGSDETDCSECIIYS